MPTYFCPVCWNAVAKDATRCLRCNADLEALDREAFDEKLIRALWHPDVETVMRAVDVLGRRQVPQAVAALIRRYEAGTDPYLASCIATALGRIGGAAAAAALERLSQDPSTIVRRAAEDARTEAPPSART